MRRAFSWLILSAVALATAVWFMPARWVMVALPAWLPSGSPVQVTAADGRLWQARAWLAIGMPGLQRSLPDPLDWTLVWDRGPRLRLQHPWLQGPVELVAGLRGLRVDSQSLRLPAVALTTLHSFFNSLDPGGELHLSWPSLHLWPGGVRTATQAPLLAVRWEHAGSGLSRVQPLGRYRLVWHADADGVDSLRVDTEAGPLQLQADVRLAGVRAQRVEAWAWADPDASSRQRAGLSPLLQALGPTADARGRHHLQWSAPLSTR